jgi:signal transduction histidine kinase
MKADDNCTTNEAVLGCLDTGILIITSARLVRAFNPSLLKLWRFPQPLRVGQEETPILEHIARQLVDVGGFRQQVERVYNLGEPESFDILQLKDGRVIERYSTLHIVAGQTVGRIWSFHDLTRAFEWERHASMSGRIESVSRLAAAIAHDVSHVFTCIEGNANLLLGSPHLAPEESAPLRKITLAARRAEHLAVQLQSFAERHLALPRVQDFNHAVARAVNKLQGSLPAAVGLLFEPAVDLPDISCQSGMIEHAVCNLASNAIEAMQPDGGQLRISTRLANIDAMHARDHDEAHPGQSICLTVTDTGCGIDQKTLSNIFDPFFTTKADQKNAGLGLARVQAIAKLHGGWVEVSSQRGYGSTFNVFLPVSAGPGADSSSRGIGELAAATSEDRWSERAGLAALGLGDRGHSIGAGTPTEESIAEPA